MDGLPGTQSFLQIVPHKRYYVFILKMLQKKSRMSREIESQGPY